MTTVIILSIITGLVAVMVYDGIHRIEEGHIGVYWRGGRLLERTTTSGYNFKLPILDTFNNVQITMQTDSVTEIPCGTSGGVVIHFDRIEVVNRLRSDYVLETIRNYGVNYDKMWIFDKIHHEINQFCSSHTLREVFIEQFDTLDESLAKALQTDCDKYNTGIQIITVRVTKPRIPESVRRNYELVEAERANLLVATERQKVIEKEAQTEANKARIHAEKQKTVREIEIAKELMEKEGVQKTNKIADEIYYHAEKTKSDADFYRVKLEADANKMRLTPEYLRFMLYTALANNTKIYFGEKIPSMFLHDPWTSVPEVATTAKTQESGH